MILVIGHGRMGQRHTAALRELGREYDLLDVDDKLEDYDFTKYSHFIVSSPNETHAQYYHFLKQFGKPILLEKPGVIEEKDLDILKDPLVSVGMSRRFHPIIRALLIKDALCTNDIKNIICVKSGPKIHEIDAHLDLGIHSIDLCCYLDVEGDSYAEYGPNKVDLMNIIYVDNSVLTIDFKNMLLIGDFAHHFLEDDSIVEELTYWLDGNRIDAYEAHELSLKGENDSRTFREIDSE